MKRASASAVVAQTAYEAVRRQAWLYDREHDSLRASHRRVVLVAPSLMPADDVETDWTTLYVEAVKLAHESAAANVPG